MVGLRPRRSGPVAAGLVLVAIAVSAGVMIRRQGSSPDIPTATVTRGEFVDALEIRGEVRPVRSVVVTAPMQAGDLQILKIAANGSMVKAGDTVVEFDATTLQHTVQDKQSDQRRAHHLRRQSREARRRRRGFHLESRHREGPPGAGRCPAEGA
jgi:multidrug efflux pump subunit AcrA (membrane-fusion protein)